MRIKIDISSVFDNVQDQLAMISKRIKNEGGEPAYTTFALSSREKGLITGLAKDAVLSVVAIAPECINNYHKDGNKILISVNNGITDDLTEMYNDLVSSYTRAYCLAQYLSMTGSELAKKYITESDVLLSNIRNSVFNRSKVLTSSSPLDETTGEIS